jgi:CBS domain containing-hemolysin-like protein
MDMHQFSEWLAATAPSQAIQASTWAIPTIQTVHIVALALVFTLGIMLALRFAGFGFNAEPLPQVAARSARRIWLLLVVLAATGLLLITAEPGRTVTNPVFYWKMGLLAAVIVLTLWLAHSAKRTEKPGAAQVAVSILAVLLWIGIIFCGRFIAYVEAI